MKTPAHALQPAIPAVLWQPALPAVHPAVHNSIFHRLIAAGVDPLDSVTDIITQFNASTEVDYLAMLTDDVLMASPSWPVAVCTPAQLIRWQPFSAGLSSRPSEARSQQAPAASPEPASAHCMIRVLVTAADGFALHAAHWQALTARETLKSLETLTALPVLAAAHSTTSTSCLKQHLLCRARG